VRHSPLSPTNSQRVIDAFHETGRGLIISMGLTALAQSVLIWVGFAISGVPQGLVLAALAGIASFIPLGGTGLVTVPTTIVMFMYGGTFAGVGCLITSVLAGVSDNVMRPLLSRFGDLQMDTFLIFIAMLGGLMLFGGGGLLLGPLVLRLGLEALRIWKKDKPQLSVAEPQLDLPLDGATTKGSE
jgi:predicted PurR-regulated permease PerM